MLEFVTVAVNAWDPVPAWTVAVVGETETDTTFGTVMVTVAAADLVVSATDTAVTVTVAGVGTAVGGV